MDTPPPPEPKQPDALTLHYFRAPAAKLCQACDKGPFEITRITTTTEGATLITLMCAECATNEQDGIVERGEMALSPDGTHYILATVAQMAGELEEQRELAHRQRDAKKKKKRRWPWQRGAK